MFAHDGFIFGDRALHHQFCVTAEILGQIISSAPKPICIAKLKTLTGLPTDELVTVCGYLMRAGLLNRRGSSSDGWILAGDPSTVTLEDVFLCIVATQESCAMDISAPRNQQNGSKDVALIVMQAAFEINQHVLKHLRQFSLDRVKSIKDEVPPFFRHTALPKAY